ncbi:hypothetical protein QMK19_17415 [Streptomyces sp. H10-C2]|uniref:hypothetical protein n=1 Tax=unclassified Streptomyces TaxID=2593676 RepID=UPI0024B8C8CD|nr:MULTISPECIES: hypothetical protein [unclassified Streptomyces]MDJ0345573.1 hypothetical protein [Streptomyces sp. PH10-H1]MDJ0371414.1 hypothetical protein [Streptomyces sp. H10-C2]
MARHPLPSILSSRPSLARSRELARTAADSATDVLHPLISITRGMRKQASWAHGWWARTPKDRRGPALLLGAAMIVVVALMPYGPLLALGGVLASAGWMGRDRTAPAPAGPSEAETEKLQALYEALAPYLSDPDDPCPLYARDGSWDSAFSEYAFEDGRLTRLHLRYPAYFTDGEAESRGRVEQLLHAKTGRGREYRFDWDEEANHLTLTALAPLSTGIVAQRFVTAPGETVLGFTDTEVVQRTVPVADGDGTRDAPPVIWRTGPRSTEPHLLALGQPGTGTTGLLRSIALQALCHGDVVIVDGSGSGEYACFIGRPGVLAVESGLAGTCATLEWAAHETERRLIAVNRARQAGHSAPEDARRPLWILVDRPTALTQLAHAEGRPDPQLLLDVPLRHGRIANVAVAVADQLDAAEVLAPAVITHTRARVLLGALAPEHARAVLGASQCTTSAAQVPAGRGYARLGTGPVLRLQVPATPDPYDDETSDAHREAVLTLLPPVGTPADALEHEPDPEPDPEPTTEPLIRPTADLER